MNLKLTKEQFEYLDNNYPDWQRFSKVCWTEEKKYILVEIDDEIIDEVRDWAIDKQSQVGFDSKYELTSIGKVLEEIIDKFYI